MKQQTRAYIYAGAAVFFWSTAASAFKLSLKSLEPIQLTFLASSASAITLLITLILSKKIPLLLNQAGKILPDSLLLCILNPCFYYFLLFQAYDLLPAQEALSINYSWPLMLVILSIFLLRQHIRIPELLAIGISYSGVIIVATKGDITGLEFTNLQGAAFALASTLVWAIYWILLVRKKSDLTVTLFLSFILSLPVLFVITNITCPLKETDLKGFSGAAYVGIFEMGITFVLWSSALRLSETTAKISGIAYLSPFLSLLIIRAVLNEQIRPSTLLGLPVIMAGIILQALLKKNARKNGVLL